MLNGALVLVLVLIGGATFAALRSSSASSATTQTTATAKRGTVLESVTSTGNVEAPTSLSLSFQQSGEVTAVYVRAGQRVVKNQALAQVDDKQQKRALESAQASLASAEASLAALKRGETGVERASDATSIASAAQSVTSAQQGVTNAQQLQADNATKYQQGIDQAQSAVTTAQSGVSTAQVTLNQANRALTSLQNTADPNASSSETTAALLTRYRVDQATCSTHTSDPTWHPSDGVNCAQIQNLLSFAQRRRRGRDRR